MPRGLFPQLDVDFDAVWAETQVGVERVLSMSGAVNGMRIHECGVGLRDRVRRLTVAESKHVPGDTPGAAR